MPELMIPAKDGGEFMAYIAYPETTPAPAILVIQEIFGVNEEMRGKCDDLAAQGYVAVCPDLFWRIEPGIQLVDTVEEQLQKAFDLFGMFDTDTGMQDLKTALNFTRDLEECSGKVGCVGYCLGGKLAYMMACQSDVDASVGYYGVAIETMLDQAENIQNPLLLHIAEEDDFVDKGAQEAIKTGLADHPMVTIHSYAGADHAFARDNGMHYKEDAAKLANARTREFFAQNLNRAMAA